MASILHFFVSSRFWTRASTILSLALFLVSSLNLNNKWVLLATLLSALMTFYLWVHSLQTHMIESLNKCAADISKRVKDAVIEGLDARLPDKTDSELDRALHQHLAAIQKHTRERQGGILQDSWCGHLRISCADNVPQPPTNISWQWLKATIKEEYLVSSAYGAGLESPACFARYFAVMTTNSKDTLAALLPHLSRSE
jgi:hypothetical protein